MNISMETLPHERLLHYKVNLNSTWILPVMDQFNMNLEPHLAPQEHMQNLPFEPSHTAVKNFMASGVDENAGLSRSETGSTISDEFFRSKQWTKLKFLIFERQIDW